MPYFDEPVCPCAQNLGEIRDRSMLSGTALAREIQLTDGSTAVEQGKLIFVVSTEPSLQQLISPFTTGKKSSFDRPYQLFNFHFEISVKKKVEKKTVVLCQNCLGVPAGTLFG